VKISGSSDSAVDPKFFSMIVPSKMTPESQTFRYFLRKGQTKMENESMIEIDEEIIKLIIDTSSRFFFPFSKQ